MEDSKDEQEPTPSKDSLDALLDSSLGDFGKPLPKLPVISSDNQNASASGSVIADAKMNDPKAPLDGDAWNEEYKQFQSVMKDIMSEDSPIKKEFSNLVESLQTTNQTTSSITDNFAETFAETIRGLTESAQNVPDPSPEELANMFKDFDLGEGNPLEGDQIPDFMPVIQSMMQNLMSKEMLYPSLKEIVDKYPDWLANKRSSLVEAEYEKYNHQYDLMKKVCEEFESECDGSDDAKKAQFEKVLLLMQKIQTYGNPPKELVGDMIDGGLSMIRQGFDEHGNMNIPGMPEQCCIM